MLLRTRISNTITEEPNAYKDKMMKARNHPSPKMSVTIYGQLNNLQYEDFSYMEQQASVRHMEPRRAKRCRWEVEALVEVRRWHRHSCAGG